MPGHDFVEVTTASERVRVVRLNRPQAKNAMNGAMWDATTDAFATAAADPGVAVVVLTGTGDSFSAGQDLREMALAAAGRLEEHHRGFEDLALELARFPKPFLCAVNGMGVGFGATVTGLADLVFMSSTARLRCPFTSLGLVPEMGSSYTFPRRMGHQRAFWALLSSEWLTATECAAAGLVYEVCPPEELMETTLRHARVLAGQPIESLVASKRLLLAALEDRVASANVREVAVLKELLGSPANTAALRAFADRTSAGRDGAAREGASGETAGA